MRLNLKIAVLPIMHQNTTEGLEEYFTGYKCAQCRMYVPEKDLRPTSFSTFSFELSCAVINRFYINALSGLTCDCDLSFSQHSYYRYKMFGMEADGSVLGRSSSGDGYDVANFGKILMFGTEYGGRRSRIYLKDWHALLAVPQWRYRK